MLCFQVIVLTNFQLSTVNCLVLVVLDNMTLWPFSRGTHGSLLFYHEKWVLTFTSLRLPSFSLKYSFSVLVIIQLHFFSLSGIAVDLSGMVQ